MEGVKINSKVFNQMRRLPFDEVLWHVLIFRLLYSVFLVENLNYCEFHPTQLDCTLKALCLNELYNNGGENFLPLKTLFITSPINFTMSQCCI